MAPCKSVEAPNKVPRRFRAVPQLTRSTLPKGPLTTKPGTYRQALTNIKDSYPQRGLFTRSAV
jgi:hypothetical protein